MPKFRLAFLVEHGRDLVPPITFAGTTLATMEVHSEEARSAIARELGALKIESLERDGKVTVVDVQMEAAGESDALVEGLRQATLSLEPYSLVFAEDNAFDFSRQRPAVLPHALLIDDAAVPGTAALRYHDGPRLVRVTAGEFGDIAKRFNASVVRHLASLYPACLFEVGAERTPLDLRVARAVHWYSQAEGQSHATMAFVCYWIGLEALTLRSSAASNKRKTLSTRLISLVQRHISDASAADWMEIVTALWNKRSDVVHEGFGATAPGLLPDIGAADINEVKYLFFVALLHVLEQRTAGVPLDELWHPKFLDAYRPGVEIDIQEFPSLLQGLGTDRTTRLASDADSKQGSAGQDSLEATT